MALAPLMVSFPQNLFPFDNYLREERTEIDDLLENLISNIQEGMEIDGELIKYFKKAMQEKFSPIFEFKSHPVITSEGLANFIWEMIQNEIDDEIIQKLNQKTKKLVESYVKLSCWIKEENWKRYVEVATPISILNISKEYLLILLEFIDYLAALFRELTYLGSLPEEILFLLQEFLSTSKLWIRGLIEHIRKETRIFVYATKLSNKKTTHKVYEAAKVSQTLNDEFKHLIPGFEAVSTLLWSYLVWNVQDYEELKSIDIHYQFSNIPRLTMGKIRVELEQLNNFLLTELVSNKAYKSVIAEIKKDSTQEKELKKDIGEILYFS